MFKNIMLAVLALCVILILFTCLVFYKKDLTREELSGYINGESQFTTLSNGANVHYRDEGNPVGPVLLMLHGGFGSLHNWEGWVPYLKQDFRLVSLDLPAHGLTGRIPNDIYTRETMNGTVRLLMEKLGISTFSIAGNSMGGGLALQYALDHPEQVEGLILIGSEGIPNGPDGYDASMFTDEKPLAPDENGYNTLTTSEKVISRFIGPSVIKFTLNELVSDKALITDEFVDWFGRIIRYTGNREANILMFRQWLKPDADPRDLENRLHEIAVPVLYMHGEDDVLVSLNIAERFDELLSDSKLIQYENSGHMSMIEQPKLTAMDILAFYRDKGLLH